MSFSEAARGDVRLLIGLSGPSGSGKTLSALRLATGMGGDGPVCLIDTEQGRALIYAPKAGEEPNPPQTYSFKHLALPAPFSPDRYRGALEAAARISPRAIIIDSMTHEWTGAGGILERVEDLQGRGGNKFAAWKEPKTAHRKMMAYIEQLDAHVILCIRAREKLIQDKDTKEIVNVGWQPISEGELPYGMTFNFLVGGAGDKGTLATQNFDHGKLPITAKGVVAEGELATEEVGRRLADWAAGRDVTNGG